MRRYLVLGKREIGLIESYGIECGVGVVKTCIKYCNYHTATAVLLTVDHEIRAIEDSGFLDYVDLVLDELGFRYVVYLTYDGGSALSEIFASFFKILCSVKHLKACENVCVITAGLVRDTASRKSNEVSLLLRLYLGLDFLCFLCMDVLGERDMLVRLVVRVHKCRCVKLDYHRDGFILIDGFW